MNKFVIFLVVAIGIASSTFLYFWVRNWTNQKSQGGPARFMPRIITQEFLEKVAAKSGGTIPHRPCFDTGLVIAYVLDKPDGFLYINSGIAEELKVNESDLYDFAMTNLRNTFPPEAFARVVQNSSLNILKKGDGYDATRLLLLPELLEDGRQVAVTIPDADTLTIQPVPSDWRSLDEIAQNAGATPLFTKPLLVTKDAIIVK